jgi:hypothetical protein
VNSRYTGTRSGLMVVTVMVLLFAPSAENPLSAQTSAVTVRPLENRTGDRSLDALAGTIRETLLLNLRLLAAAGGIDAGGTVTGTIERDSATGEFVITADLLDPRSGESVARPEVRAAGLLAVFDAADELTDHVLVALAGRRIEYGSFAALAPGFTPGPAAGELQFTLGDQPVGSGTQVRLSTVISGDYEMTVRQQRLLGTETIYRQTVRIQPGREAVVRVAVPPLTNTEEDHFATVDSAVFAALQAGTPHRHGRCWKMRSPLSTMPPGRNRQTVTG